MGVSANVPVNNPKKTITVDFPINTVKSKMKHLCRESEYFKEFKDDNAVIGEYELKFKTPISGLLDLGMTATINLTDLQGTQTKIDIEVADNWDAVDDSYELKSAQMLISEITKSFGFILSHTDEEIAAAKNKPVSGFGKFLHGLAKFIGWSILIIIVLAIICS